MNHPFHHVFDHPFPLWMVGCALLLLLIGSGCQAAGSSTASSKNLHIPEQTEQEEQEQTIQEDSIMQDTDQPDAPYAASEDLELWVMSDPHYLSLALFENDADFSARLEQGDGKMTEIEEEFLDAFLDQLITAHPDALLIPGDLTFNGERQSLLDLKEKLLRVQEAGIPVLVIPGNHDIESPYASRYTAHGVLPAENISQEEFTEICAPFGYEQALSQDPDSFSYLYPISDTVSILMLDCNTPAEPGTLSASTLEWADAALSQQEGDPLVLSVSHQNVLPHNPLFIQGFVMDNAEEAAAFLRDHGVEQHISGHAHLQNTSTVQGLTDTATGSFAVGPLRYLKVSITPSGSVYLELCAMDDYNQPGIERFERSNREKARQTVAELAVTDEEAQLMEEFAVRANEDYFFGTLNAQELLQDPAWQLWNEKGKGTFLHVYLSSFIES